MSTIVLPKYRKVLSTDSNEIQFEPMTKWMASISLFEVMTLFELREANTGFNATVAFQTAETDPTAPDEWQPLGNMSTKKGKVCSGTLNLSKKLATKFFVRFGVGVMNSNTSNKIARGEVVLQLSGRA